jgi:hypothetical protein
MFRSLVAASAVALAMVPGLASATTVATLTAGYDRILEDPYFIITNTSNSTETGLTLTTSFGPQTTVTLGSLGAGQSEKYEFNGNSGGFLVGGGYEVHTPESTTYQLSLTLGGQMLQSNIFSTSSNLTGAYVDFLGDVCGVRVRCTVPNNGARSGVVANITAAVPEPTTWAMLIIGFVGIAARLRRAVRQYA